MDQNKIRNFCIIAHIDHGKSTLADRFLEITKTVEKRKMKAQLLDTMELERERGITIKLQPVQMHYKNHVLNLIDTPGHVDFSYEVSRSLAAVEGVILLVDASQGIEAQTLANLHLAQDLELRIIPVVNKIDLPGADIKGTKTELANLLGIKNTDILEVSGKTGAGSEKLLDKILLDIPFPKGDIDKPCRALIFDSAFDKYKGVIAYIRVVDGRINTGDGVKMMATEAEGEALEIGVFNPGFKKTGSLQAGDIGYIATGLRNVNQVKVGDTIVLGKTCDVEPLAGYQQVNPFVYAGIFTIDNNDYAKLRDALEKLVLSDSSLIYTPENSPALGFGFRCGFLGLLHLEIVKERLEREFNLDLIATTPTVSYQITLNDGSEKFISNPTELPPANKLNFISEPWVKIEVLSPVKYLGAIIELLQGKRGIQKNIEHLDQNRVLISYEIPLNSIIVNFYDQLKSISSGYASINYEFLEYREGDLVKIDILVAEASVDALSIIADRPSARSLGISIIEKLKKLIPRQNFKIVLQAAIGGKIIARDDIPPFRKDVLAKLYGGDRTRKDKLLKKQAKGKKRMKSIGKVDIPQDAFLKLMK